MKFKIGQPVWAVGHCSGKWYPSVIVGLSKSQCSRCACGGESYGEHYEVSLENGSRPNNPKWPYYTPPANRVHPRDPGQFEHAEEGFQLRITKRTAHETEVATEQKNG